MKKKILGAKQRLIQELAIVAEELHEEGRKVIHVRELAKRYFKSKSLPAAQGFVETVRRQLSNVVTVLSENGHISVTVNENIFLVPTTLGTDDDDNSDGMAELVPALSSLDSITINNLSVGNVAKWMPQKSNPAKGILFLNGDSPLDGVFFQASKAQKVKTGWTTIGKVVHQAQAAREAKVISNSEASKTLQMGNKIDNSGKKLISGKTKT